MKLSYTWLNEFVDLKDISPEDLKNELTMKAFEVEEIETMGLTGPVVVGEILDISKHPDADKIRITQIRLEEGGEPTQIVCGAQNIEVGQRIPVCLPGAVVINRKTGEGLQIAKSQIRGVTSNGMLASASELGITTSDIDGIHILSKPGESSSFQLGQNALELLNLMSDQVFHVGTRSNRGDALCVKGMAREVCALTKRKLIETKTKNEKVAKVFSEAANSGSGFSVSIDPAASEDCQFFSIIVIKDLKVAPSPTWLANRLTAMGLRPVNNIVDITNYVMLELGQPLHAYDLDKLDTKSIVVRRARSGEKMLCIDGKERAASDEVLAITSGDAPVGYAGIMGGKESEISDSTTAIALEAAWFKPARVRRGSRLLGLSSDSSLRFERGVDLASVKTALERATDLIVTLCGTQKTTDQLQAPFTAGSDQIEDENSINVRMSRVAKLLEISLDSSQAAELLQPLGFKTDALDKANLKVTAPSYRVKDVQREIDVIEEIARLYGYDNIPVSSPSSTASPIPRERLVNDLKSKLIGQGFSEVWASSLRGESDFAGYESESEAMKSVVRVLNPLSADHQTMRQSLLPGLLEVVNYNQSRGERNVWFFEQGRGYKAVDGKPQEYTLLSGVMTGKLLKHVSHGGTETNTIDTDFFRLKGVVENILEAARVSLEKVLFTPLGKEDFYSHYLHPHKSARISFVTKQIMGILGEVHPRMAAKYDIKDPVFAFELFVDVIKASPEKMSFQEPVLNPSIARDLTADVENSVEQDKVYKAMMQVGKREGMSCDLVSTYQLSDGQKSLSYHLTFRQKDPLNSEQVDEIVQKVREALSKRVNARFRG